MQLTDYPPPRLSIVEANKGFKEKRDVKNKALVLIVLVFVAAILPLAGAAASGTTVVEFEGKEYIVDAVPPVETFPGGNYHARGAEYFGYEAATSSCVTGPSHVISNVILNKNGKGHIGGTFDIEPEAYTGEGAWKTTWHVNQDDFIVAVGHGTGLFQGMTIRFLFTDEGIDENGEYLVYSGTLRIPANSPIQCAE